VLREWKRAKASGGKTVAKVRQEISARGWPPSARWPERGSQSWLTVTYMGDAVWPARINARTASAMPMNSHPFPSPHLQQLCVCVSASNPCHTSPSDASSCAEPYLCCRAQMCDQSKGWNYVNVNVNVICEEPFPSKLSILCAFR
jgi:hypothetical protein